MTSTVLLAVKKCYVLTRTKKVISVYNDGLDCTNEIHQNLKRKYIKYTDVSSLLSVHMKEIAYILLLLGTKLDIKSYANVRFICLKLMKLELDAKIGFYFVNKYFWQILNSLDSQNGARSQKGDVFSFYQIALQIFI